MAFVTIPSSRIESPEAAPPLAAPAAALRGDAAARDPEQAVRKLVCTPDSVSMFCETSSQTTVRVRTSDRQAGVALSAIGYDTSRVIVSPTRAVTGPNGQVDFTVKCQGGAFCPCDTTVTFSADGGDYLEV